MSFYHKIDNETKAVSIHPICRTTNKGPDTALAISDETLDVFEDTDDLRAAVAMLSAIVDLVSTEVPYMRNVTHWPPAKMFTALDSESKYSRLYETLEVVLSASGYSVMVLTTIKVVSHEPKKVTIFEIPPHWRVVRN